MIERRAILRFHVAAQPRYIGGRRARHVWKATRTRAHDAQQVHQRFERNERFGRDIHARIAELRSLPREKLADTVFMLSMVAKQQSSPIQQSIKERTKVNFDFDAASSGDLATYLAEHAANTLRIT